MVPLKSVARAFPSNVDKHSKEGELPVRLCNYTDVYYNDIVDDQLDFMEATATAEEIKKFTLKRGDTIITKDSETADDIGRSAYVSDSLPGVLCGYHLSVIRPNDRLDGRFIKRLFDSKYLRAVMEVSANGLTRVGLGQYAIDNLDIPLPPLEEQVLIADFLDRETAKIDALIAKQEQLIATLREDRTATITHAVTKGLDPTVGLKRSGVPWIGEVPSKWDVVNIRRVATMKTGHTPSRSVAAYWENTTIPWFALADVWQLRDGKNIYLGETANCISELGLANSAAELLPAGTVVFSRTASVGFSGIMPAPMATSQDFWNWVCGARLLPEYLVYVFRAMKGHFAALMMGSTHKTIYQGDAAAIRIPVPPLPEQREIIERIVSKTEAVDALAAKAEKMISTWREYRSALITDAVTGKIDVRGAA